MREFGQCEASTALPPLRPPGTGLIAGPEWCQWPSAQYLSRQQSSGTKKRWTDCSGSICCQSECSCSFWTINRHLVAPEISHRWIDIYTTQFCSWKENTSAEKCAKKAFYGQKKAAPRAQVSWSSGQRGNMKVSGALDFSTVEQLHILPTSDSSPELLPATLPQHRGRWDWSRCSPEAEVHSVDSQT